MSVQAIDSSDEERQLGILINNFLLNEYIWETYCTESEKNIILGAQTCLQIAYRMTFYEVCKSPAYSLTEIFNIARFPIPVKYRIAAKEHKEKGNEFMRAERFDLAEVEYNSAVERDPRNPIYYCNRAAARIRLLMYTSAIADCKKALELDRHYAKAYGWLGLARAMTGHPVRAIRCYKKALEIEPDSEVYLVNMQLINRRVNRIAFLALKPFLMCSRSSRLRMLTGADDHQVMLRLMNGGGSDEVELTKMEATCDIKYTIEDID